MNRPDEGRKPELIVMGNLSHNGGGDDDDAAPPEANNAGDEGIMPLGDIDPVYEAKAKLLNHAIQEIGMGRYQWQLFAVAGFGWASDNLWPVVLSLIYTPVALELLPDKPPLLALSQNIGLLMGAMFWGFGCDMFGRRWAFNLTLGTTAVFGLAAAGAPNFTAIATAAALWSFGVGGNLPVDSAIFLEFLPASHQYLLTVLSFTWSLSQVIATSIAWPLLGNFTCQIDAKECTKGENMGWRYSLITIGGLTMVMFLLRFSAFTIYESPKYLASKGDDAKAVRVVYMVARRNGKMTTLTVDQLTACENGYAPKTSASSLVMRQLEDVKLHKVQTLFATKKLALSTSLIMTIWAFIGLGYPLYITFLPFIQTSKGADFGDGSTYLTYRNSLIIAVVGLPGALVGAYLVERPRIGRKGTLCVSTILTGVFLYGSTTALNSDALLGWNCAFSFTSNVMYSVLYSYTPELFPTPSRGTGNALTATCNRIFGIMAPIVAMVGDIKTPIPVYVSGALFIAAGVLVVFLPFESRGKAAL
ncbi:MFS siderochrome iron transporter 1 [Rhypophila decipiens]